MADPRVRYTPELAFEIYELAKSGLRRNQIAQAMGLPEGRLARWQRRRPDVAAALRAGKARRELKTGGSFIDYAYRRMTADQQAAWDELETIRKSGAADTRRAVEQVFRGRHHRLRQSMYLHALAACNFNMTEAGRRVGVTRVTLDNWLGDPGFAGLLDQVMAVKKDLGEEQLWRLVRRGDKAAVIFFNKTINKDRGYGDGRAEVEHTHTHQLKAVPIEQLLSVDQMRSLLERHRAVQGATALPAHDGVTEAELVGGDE